MSALPLDKKELRSIDARWVLRVCYLAEADTELIRGCAIRRYDYDWWGHIYVRPGGSTREGSPLSIPVRITQHWEKNIITQRGRAGKSERGADREYLLPKLTSMSTSIERTVA